MGWRLENDEGLPTFSVLDAVNGLNNETLHTLIYT